MGEPEETLPPPTLQTVSSPRSPSVQNLMPDSGFESSAGGWHSYYGGSTARSTTQAKSGSYSLRMYNRTQTWSSPGVNLYPMIKEHGPGGYAVSLWVYVRSFKGGESSSGARLVIRGTGAADENSFIIRYPDGNYYALLNSLTTKVTPGKWINLSATFTVEQEDLVRTNGNFLLMLDTLAPTDYLYIDDVILSPLSDGGILDSGVSTASLIGAEQYNHAELTPYNGYIHVKRNGAYDSVAYNFVNILHAYGPGVYRFRFRAKLDEDAAISIQNMSPYISTSLGQHYSLGPVSLSQNFWQSYELEVSLTQAMFDFYGFDGYKTFLRFQANLETLSGFYIADVEIIPPVIANGIYYFKNAGTAKYMDIDGPSGENGAQIHQWDLHGDTSQRWEISYVSGDDYSIRSVYSGRYLSVANNSTGQNAAMVQNPFDWLDGQLFQFERTAAGNIKITPRTGQANNRVLCIGWSVANTNGVNIEQRNYIEDSNYIDEWILEKRVERYILRSFISDELPSSSVQTVSNVVSFSQTLNGMFNRSFGVSINFEMPKVIAMEVEKVHSGACTSSCGVCSETYSPTQTNVHHRNVVRQTRAELSKMRKTGNQIHALWYSEAPETFCAMDYDEHIFMSPSDVGISCGLMPVLQLFNRDNFEYDEPVDVYRYALLHETTHIFGVTDFSAHNQECVMKYRNPEEDAYARFLERLSNGHEAWCTNCKAIMMRRVGWKFD